MMEIKLAEALLRRKELAEKLNIVRQIKDAQLIYQVRNKRIQVTEQVESLDVDYPKLTLSQVTEEFDFVAKQLRLVDALIQQTNWTTVLEVDPMVMQSYSASK
jgi:tRNA A-37 threonylcarbamoyl transferase component Bud32